MNELSPPPPITEPPPPRGPIAWLTWLVHPAGRGDIGEGQSTPKQRRHAFQILFMSLVCLGVGQAGMFAILPPISRQLGLSEFSTGAIFAVSATIWVFSSAFWGARSDRWGRRPMVVLGLAAFAVSTFCFATSVEIGLLGWLPLMAVYALMVGSRAIYGIFGSAGFPAAQGYIADRTSAHERTHAVATLNAAFGLGTTMGPGVIAALAILGNIAPFYFIAAWGALAAFVIWRFLPERTAPVLKEKDEATLSWLDPRIFPFIVFGVLLGTAGSIPIQTVSYFLMDELHIGQDDAVQMSGVAMMASSMAALFAQLVIVQRLQIGASTLIYYGIGIGFLSYVFFTIGASYGIIVFSLLLSGLAFGLIRPGYAAASSLSVGKDQQGAAAGLTGGATASGFIFAPLIGNYMYEHIGPRAPYILGAALMVLMAIYLVLAPRLRSFDVEPEPETEAETNVPKV